VALIAEALLHKAIRPIEAQLPEQAPTGQPLLLPHRQVEVVVATEVPAVVVHHALLERELRAVAVGAIKKSKIFKN
tara:strand:- start:192016 stop:192243 length:228 start_codon:yes stop_codon:yes gene_type:complete